MPTILKFIFHLTPIYTPELVTAPRLEACVRDVSDWMSSNNLKLNFDKTELLLIASQFCPKPQLRR